MTLSIIDWLIMLVYFVFVLGIGFALKRYMRTSNDFFLAGRSIPAWVCGLAFISANLGAQEVIGMAASGAKYGINTSHFYWIGAIPAMIFVGIFMMPFYYGSKARSVPEFLRLRFDEKTRAVNAFSFAIMTVLSSGISMYAMALLIQTLGLFRGIIPDQYIFHVSVFLSAIIVLAYIFLGGLTSAIYNEVLQFFLIVAGFAPLVWIGLRNVGGWQGIRHTLPASMTHSWRGMAHANTNTLGVEWIGLAMGLGFVLSFGYWCTDFLVIQRAMAADSEISARKVPLIAAIPKMFFPFLVILPGLIAVSITPHEAPGSPAAILGSPSAVSVPGAPPHGIVPQKTDPLSGKPVLDSHGNPVYNYDLAIPVMLLHFFPTGILGLGLTALLASFMSGMAGNVTAFNTVWTYDIYQAYINKRATDAHYLWMGRMATMGESCSPSPRLMQRPASTTSWTRSSWSSPLSTLRCSPPFCWACSGSAPQDMGLSPACFPGLSLLCCIMVSPFPPIPLPASMAAGSPWCITTPAIWHRTSGPPSSPFRSILIVTIAVSLVTRPRPDHELVGLVYSLTPKPVENHLEWYQKPSTLAFAVLGMLVILNLVFA